MHTQYWSYLTGVLYLNLQCTISRSTGARDRDFPLPCTLFIGIKAPKNYLLCLSLDGNRDVFMHDSNVPENCKHNCLNCLLGDFKSSGDAHCEAPHHSSIIMYNCQFGLVI